eukprot:7276551-Alexandrium_andersonii.AAC.1
MDRSRARTRPAGNGQATSTHARAKVSADAGSQERLRAGMRHAPTRGLHTKAWVPGCTLSHACRLAVAQTQTRTGVRR